MERENKGISMLEETIMNIQKIKIFEKDDHGNKKVNAVFELSSEIGKGQITIDRALSFKNFHFDRPPHLWYYFDKWFCLSPINRSNGLGTFLILQVFASSYFQHAQSRASFLYMSIIFHHPIH